MDRLTLKQAINKIIDQEVNLRSKERYTGELTIKVTFYEGGIRECRSTAEQILTVNDGH